MRFLLLVLVFGFANALNNGLARTPPMGWMAWERFRCITDCDAYPDTCISENLIKSIADALVSTGLDKAGYRMVSIDDCWAEMERDPKTHRLVGDKKRFPSGMRALSDYIHKAGTGLLKFGIYGDIGTKTCAGYPGTEGYFKVDADTFADWKVDMLKLDGCYTNTTTMNAEYPKMTKALNATDHPVLFDCSWPDYVRASGVPADYKLVAQHCNVWRNFDDMEDSWLSVKSTLKFYGDDEGKFLEASGPGAWNSADELITGDFGLSHDQQQLQIVAWAMFPSPLFLSSDVRHISQAALKMLTNPNLIFAMNDKLGKSGRRVYDTNNESGIEVWYRPLANTKAILAVFNLGDKGTPTRHVTSLRKMGVTVNADYQVFDLISDKSLGVTNNDQPIQFDVNPTGVAWIGVIQSDPPGTVIGSFREDK